MGQKCRYLAKNFSFGPNLAVFEPKILIFTGVSKSFGTQITEEPPRQLVRIVFWSGMRPKGPKMPLFGQKCQFWAKFGRFLAKKTIFWAVGVKLLVPSYNHLGVPNNVQPSLGNIEPVLGVHATTRQRYLIGSLT